jgi:hypothetical protein
MWERDALSERVAQAWEEAGLKASLGDVRMSLGKVMGRLQDLELSIGRGSSM